MRIKRRKKDEGKNEMPFIENEGKHEREWKKSSNNKDSGSSGSIKNVHHMSQWLFKCLKAV